MLPNEEVKVSSSSIQEAISKAVSEEREEYEDIFKWLLGENGDFPESEPGKRYGFRTELRKRLATIKNKPI